MEDTSNFKKKSIRRMRKYSNMLQKETGISATSSSQFLMVCNVGLVSGIEREKIVNIFTQYAVVQQVIMVPQKSYCFIQCSDTKNAQHAFHAIHGKLSILGTNRPTYLLFIEKMPLEEHSVPESYLKVEGLVIVDDFINEAEEQYLIRFMGQEFRNEMDVGTMKHRSVKHYGYEFNYKTNHVLLMNSTCDAIPEAFEFILARIRSLKDCKNWVPDQLTVNKYLPGQGIPAHVDTHSCFDDFILSVSVGSDTVMNFKNKSGLLYSTILRNKSLLIMKDESRYIWTHGITPRKYDVVKNEAGDLTVKERHERISFTFRKLRRSKICDCGFSDFCDSKKKSINGKFSISNDLASELEKLHVHEIYDEIAYHFSETRHKPWSNIENFVMSFPLGSVFIDVGCGNGKYFNLNTEVYEIGCDRSLKLNEESHKKGNEALICNCLELPFRSEVADYCICIAVIHHLSTKQRRLQAINEIARILRPNGQALIYVWAKNQEQDSDLSNYLKQGKRKKKLCDESMENVIHSIRLSGSVDTCRNEGKSVESGYKISLPIHVNRTQFKCEDMLVPWKLNKNTKEDSNKEKQTFLRYYHIFEQEELEELCNCVAGIEIIESYYDQGNWCVKFKKRMGTNI